MKPIVIIALCTALLIALAFVIYHVIKIDRLRKIETTYLALLRGISTCTTHEDWQRWRDLSNHFLNTNRKHLELKAFLEYEQSLQLVLEDKLTLIYQNKTLKK